MIYLGITAGRFLSGIVSGKLGDRKMVRLGEAVAILGVAVVLLPLGEAPLYAGLTLVGLGCAPIYPCVIHSTPAYFGADLSQAIVGVQMACAYMGSMVMPPLFGLIAQHTSIAIYPWYLLVLLAVMTAMHEVLRRQRADA